jgi:hypothetical protein
VAMSRGALAAWLSESERRWLVVAALLLTAIALASGLLRSAPSPGRPARTPARAPAASVPAPRPTLTAEDEPMSMSEDLVARSGVHPV